MLHVAPYAPHLPATPDTPYDASNYPQSELPAYQQTPAQSETDLSDKPPWVQQWAVQQNVFGTNPEGTRLRQLRALKSVDDAVDESSRSSSRRARPPTRSPSSHPTTGISGGNTGSATRASRTSTRCACRC